MKINKKLGVIVCILITVTIGVAATSPKPIITHYTNLKVLPKDISSKNLQEIMVDDFQDGLGVTCSFCHANSKDGHGLDFASDAKPEKEISRAMMRMTIGINKKYFKLKHPLIGSGALTITCSTCHKGEAFPDGTGEQK
ncbi:c-type cytochrome [Mucilaginibacter sabulilitoris]|uniref:Photosynthetic reaction center cytochrome c subunit n=1 Tax=Mucilaginibacter sabulilitoris TaxID=1173583 RepID=A0ABZ0TVC3_9SPHI|nr:c-type cytochrome [Mucilaginibacter sabulilitoris]WPU97046.1 c-type cytochrome [Mucilaginibacter sabulilitoris]